MPLSELPKHETYFFGPFAITKHCAGKNYKIFEIVKKENTDYLTQITTNQLRL